MLVHVGRIPLRAGNSEGTTATAAAPGLALAVVMAMAYPHYRSHFGDTTFTKVFVGGLAWETPTEEMRRYFERFGEILEAVIINDKSTGKSKGYGFVTFRDPESARKACVDPNPIIDGRRANCNIASFGRPRPSPPRGRNQGGSPYQGGRTPPAAPGSAAPGSSFISGGVPTQPLPPPPPPPPPHPPPVFYSPYGFHPYSPEYGYHQQAPFCPVQQPPYYHPHIYGPTSSSSSAVPSPYYYGYSPSPPRGTYSGPPSAAHHHAPPPSYLYYTPPPVAEPAAVAPSPVSPFHPPPPPTLQPVGHLFPPSKDSRQITPQPSSTGQQTMVPPTSTTISEGPISLEKSSR